jgi:membrane complex biogenesis BtpA family protein
VSCASLDLVDAQHAIASLFGARRALVGMIHVAALPGTPRAEKGVAAIAEAAAREARQYQEAGFHGVMIENMHDRPYLKGAAPPEVVACMTAVACEVKRATSLPLGVQVLAGANREALAVAQAAGADFVRAEGFVFAHVADEGIIESSAGILLRYRRAIGAENVRVFVDVKKKHAAHTVTADVDIVETAHAAAFFLADGVIVTGTATGRPADPAEVRAVGQGVEIPVLVGSGITAENIGAFADADGFIVGSWLKKDGDWTRPLDPERLEALVRAFRALSPP